MCQGTHKRAFLNPANHLYIFWTASTMSMHKLTQSLYSIDLRVITLNFSENGILNNLVFARTAFPGGYRNNNNGNYNNIGNNGYFWSSTENNSNNAWKRKLNYNNSEVNRNNNNKKNGFSVRCIRDLKRNGIFPSLRFLQGRELSLRSMNQFCFFGYLSK